MPKEVINNGDNSRAWSDPQVWQSGAVPKSNPGLTISVGPSSNSFDDIASPDPFVVKEVDFQPNQPGQLSSIQVNDGTLEIRKVVSGNGASTSILGTTTGTGLNIGSIENGVSIDLDGKVEIGGGIGSSTFGGGPCTDIYADP